MRKLPKLMLITLASAGLALGAVSAASGHCRHAGFNQEKFTQYLQKRESRLHDQLKLNATQEPAWKNFVEKMQPIVGAEPRHEELAGLTAPQRMERMASMMKQREARMTERVAAVKAFYATLTPEQQKAFDANFMAPRHGDFGRGK